MACKHTPDLVEKRRKMRFRSGVRAFLAAGAVLLALFLLYTAARSILVSVSQQRWKKNISSAIGSGDTTQIAYLLEKCRKEAPYLAEKPIFKLWEKSLLQLMNEESSRRQEFRKRLNALQQKLQKSVKLSVHLKNRSCLPNSFCLANIMKISAAYTASFLMRYLKMHRNT